MSDERPWNSSAGVLAGVAVGLVLWWSSYEPGRGLFQNWKLIALPAVIGMLIVAARNRRKKVGAWDPKNREPQP